MCLREKLRLCNRFRTAPGVRTNVGRGKLFSFRAGGGGLLAAGMVTVLLRPDALTRQLDTLVAALQPTRESELRRR